MAADSNPTNPYAEDDLLVRADAAAVRSRADRDNPYAAPDVHLFEVAEPKQKPSAAAPVNEILRDGPHLVVGGAAQLPLCCLQCGTETNGELMLTLATIQPPRLSERIIQGALCPDCWRRHRWGEWLFSAGYCWLIFAMIGAVCGGIYGLYSESYGGMIFFALSSFAPPALLMHNSHRLLATLTHLQSHGDWHWFSGAKEPFLTRFSPFRRQVMSISNAPTRSALR